VSTPRADLRWDNRIAVTHPMRTFVGAVALFALFFIALGWDWIGFAVVGVLMPAAVVGKMRGRNRTQRDSD
jgi:hypothetical protein